MNIKKLTARSLIALAAFLGLFGLAQAQAVQGWQRLCWGADCLWGRCAGALSFIVLTTWISFECRKQLKRNQKGALEIEAIMLNLFARHSRRILQHTLLCVLRGCARIADSCATAHAVCQKHCKAAAVLSLGLVSSYTVMAAQVCFDPSNGVLPSNITATGDCNGSIRAELELGGLTGWSPSGFLMGSEPSSCTLSFSAAVKNVTVDIGAHTCLEGVSCQTASFEIDGVHRSISDSELTPLTDYSLRTGEQSFDPASALVLLNGDVLGSTPAVFNGNGSGKITFPSTMSVQSIKITNTSSESSALKDTSWFNVCYDGLAVTLPTVTVSKVSKAGVGNFSFNGTTNANGFPTNGSYAISTDTPGLAKSGSLVTLTATNTVTEIQETMPPGWVLSGASCTDANAATNGNIAGTFGILQGNTLQIPAAMVVPEGNLQCTFTNSYVGSVLSGKVILDTGVGSGTAHNGAQEGTEPGQSGVVLTLTNCAGTVYSTATSGGDGSFSLSLAGAPANQPACLVQSVPVGYQAVSVNVGNTAGTGYTASTATLRFTPTSGSSYNNVVLGNALLSTLITDGMQQTIAGSAVVYAHIYTAGSAGSVQFGTSEAPNPAGMVWTSVVFRDINCDGQLDGGDTVLTTSVTVAAGDRVCLLNRVFTPIGASNGALDRTTLTATEIWATTTLSPSSQSRLLKNTDLTMVSSVGLTLIKEVRTLSTCPSTALESLGISTAYSVGGSARPGAALEYRLRYSNNTVAPLTGVQLHDMVPYYTVFRSALCLSTPLRGITGCTVAAPSSGATNGAITWSMGDASAAVTGLQPQDTGAVSYCVQVQSN